MAVYGLSGRRAWPRQAVRSAQLSPLPQWQRGWRAHATAADLTGGARRRALAEELIASAASANCDRTPRPLPARRPSHSQGAPGMTVRIFLIRAGASVLPTGLPSLASRKERPRPCLPTLPAGTPRRARPQPTGKASSRSLRAAFELSRRSPSTSRGSRARSGPSRGQLPRSSSPPTTPWSGMASLPTPDRSRPGWSSTSRSVGPPHPSRRSATAFRSRSTTSECRRPTNCLAPRLPPASCVTRSPESRLAISGSRTRCRPSSSTPATRPGAALCVAWTLPPGS